MHHEDQRALQGKLVTRRFGFPVNDRWLHLAGGYTEAAAYLQWNLKEESRPEHCGIPNSCETGLSETGREPLEDRKKPVSVKRTSQTLALSIQETCYFRVEGLDEKCSILNRQPIGSSSILPWARALCSSLGTDCSLHCA